jgi:hypothetical protein
MVEGAATDMLLLLEEETLPDQVDPRLQDHPDHMADPRFPQQDLRGIHRRRIQDLHTIPLLAGQDTRMHLSIPEVMILQLPSDVPILV